MRRMVDLDAEALSWALAVLKDERVNVTQRGQMTPQWQAKYTRAETHLRDLLKRAVS